MKILILGGTIFLGRHLVEAALARGHVLTLFHRGQHGPELFPEVERVSGDRDGGLDALKGRTWDAVIDTCGYVPRLVGDSARLLSDAVGHYTFISTISVYANFREPQISEEAALATMEDETVEQVTGETYGPLKVLCEKTVSAALPGRSLILRPGLIVGPHDPSDRFTYWPTRAAQGGAVLVPGVPEQRIEFIDVRDLAEWNVRLVEAGQTGIYNATGPADVWTMQSFLEACRQSAGTDARFIYVPSAFLQENGVDPNRVSAWYTEPEGSEYEYIWNIDSRRARDAGLTYRPVPDTIRDTREWDRSRSADLERRIGLKPEQERDLLELSAKRHP